MNLDDAPGPPLAGQGFRRVALLVEYDGTNYRGVQRQSETPDTIQEKFEHAARVLGSVNPHFIAAGRTDTGVHAMGQVIALNLPIRLPEQRLARALNSLLPPDIRVRRAVTCADDFSPRLDGRLRTYVYRLCDRSDVPPILRHCVAWTPYRLDPGLTAAAARCFEGRWELREWRASTCQATRTLLTITEARAFPPGDGDSDVPTFPSCWQFRFRARSFLHHQVRMMMGGVIAAGSGRLPLDELARALAEGRRPGIVKCEPACGLCFISVQFAEGRDPFRDSTPPAEQPARSELD